jgi:hypothetical protein
MLRRLTKRFPALFECVDQPCFERLQFANLGADNSQLLSYQIPHVYAHFLWVTLNRKQLADFTERKPESLRLLDELQVCDLALMVEPITSLGSHRARQETGLFLKADGVDAQTSFLSDLPYL